MGVMAVVIRLLGWADQPPKMDGLRRFVAAFDPDRVHRNWQTLPGKASVWVTTQRRQARRFPTNADAMQFWAQQSTTLPLRPDGKPNRPLTAMHVLIEPEAES